MFFKDFPDNCGTHLTKGVGVEGKNSTYELCAHTPLSNLSGWTAVYIPTLSRYYSYGGVELKLFWIILVFLYVSTATSHLLFSHGWIAIISE